MRPATGFVERARRVVEAWQRRNGEDPATHRHAVLVQLFAQELEAVANEVHAARDGVEHYQGARP